MAMAYEREFIPAAAARLAPLAAGADPTTTLDAARRTGP